MDEKAKHAGSPPRRHLAYRSRHRAQSHDAAHADDHAPPAALPEHPLIPRGGGELIIDDAALASLIAHLRQSGQFAYDSEFIGELTYHPQLCLIQVATASRIALIDPLGGVDLRPFWEILADPAVEKIVHAGAQDIEPVHRHTGHPAANVFDTQLAAGFCGLAYPVALSKLVGELLGHKLAKGLTFTDWQRRPLSASQLRYAADDVRFLPALSAVIKRRLGEFGNLAFAQAECAAMCDPMRYAFDPDADFLHLRGAATLSLAQLSVLRELMIWREAAAVEADVPPRTFVRDEALIDLSRQPAKSVDRLHKVKFLPRPVIEQHGQAIVARTAAALARPPENLSRPHHVEPTPSDRFRAEAVWVATATICLSQGIDPAVVTSPKDIAELSRAWSAGESVDQFPVMNGWRRAAVGEQLLRLLRGEDDLRARWIDGRLQ